MQSAAIVPNHQIANPPFLRPMMGARVDVFPQRIEQSFAFFGRHTWYIGIWSATEEESWLTCCRVSYYKRMNSAWPLFMAIGFVIPMTQLTRGVARRIVLAHQTLDPPEQVIWQRLVSLVHVIERSIATRIRHLARMQQARFWWNVVVGHVLVPYEFRIAQCTKLHTIFDNVGKHRDLRPRRIVRRTSLPGWCHVEDAKPSTEFRQTVVVKLLAAKPQY